MTPKLNERGNPEGIVPEPEGTEPDEGTGVGRDGTFIVIPPVMLVGVTAELAFPTGGPEPFWQAESKRRRQRYATDTRYCRLNSQTRCICCLSQIISCLK